MSKNNAHPLITVTGASRTEYGQLQAWLKDYEVSEGPGDTRAGIKLDFDPLTAADRHMTFSVDYPGQTAPSKEPVQQKQYRLPMQSFNEATLQLTLNLIIRKKEEMQKNRDYQYAFRHAQDIILVADCDYEILNANPAAVKKFAYSKEELLQMNVRALFEHPKDGDEFVKHICSSEELIREYMLNNKQGERFPAMLRATMMNEEEGLFLIVVRDITRKKELETVKAKQDQLTTTGKMARIIAHELRNPLYNIILASSVAGQQNGHQSEEQEIIQRNCKRIDNLIRQLLEPEQWNELNASLTTVDDIIEQALALAGDRIQIRKTIVEKRITQNATLSLDIEKIRAALVNLLVNAVEAIDHDHGQIIVEAGYEDTTPFIRISDNGKGIREEEQQELFSPYYTTKEHGMGLGLVNVHQIVTAHGGLLQFTSREGQGTAFTLRFPLQQKPEA